LPERNQLDELLANEIDEVCLSREEGVERLDAAFIRAPIVAKSRREAAGGRAAECSEID